MIVALHADGRRRYGLDRSTLPSVRTSPTKNRRSRTPRSSSPGFSSNPYRPELRGHHSPHARPGNDLVALAALHLGALCTSIIQLLGTPVVAVTIVLVAAERALHLGILIPNSVAIHCSFQHLFRFYSHPAVYIMILPSMGRDHRDHCVLLAQAHFRLPLRRVLIHRHRSLWLFSCGLITCS